MRAFETYGPHLVPVKARKKSRCVDDLALRDCGAKQTDFSSQAKRAATCPRCDMGEVLCLSTLV